MYNSVLGVKGAVTSDQLKSLYRKKAKLLHPDRNADPKSHEQFVLLHEAYEFYSQLIKSESVQGSPAVFNSKKYPEHYYSESWNAEKRKEARRKAAEKAKMKYQHFEQMGYFKRLDKLYYILAVFRFLFALGLLIVLPVFSFMQEGIKGVLVVLFIQFITYPLWSKAIKRFI